MTPTANRVRVSRSKHAKGSRGHGRGPKYWQVRQRMTTNHERVFVYCSYEWAIRNAVRIARYEPISTFGLRGFQIEEVS